MRLGQLTREARRRQLSHRRPTLLRDAILAGANDYRARSGAARKALALEQSAAKEEPNA